MEKKEYSYKIENANFILIFLVVCLHSSLLGFVSEGTLLFNIYKGINIICDVAVPTFFLISSYLYYKNFEMNKYKQKLKSRIKTLVIPYFLWSTIFYFYYAILTNIPVIREIVNENHVQLSLGVAVKSIVFASCAKTIWFIRTLFIFAIISPVIYYFTKRITNKVLQFFIFVIFIIVSLFFNAGYTSILFWLPVHYIGAIFGINYKKINIFDVSKSNNIFMILYGITIFIIAYISNNDKSVGYYIYRCLSPFVILYFIDRPILNSKKINVLDSFFIFCIHLPIIQVVRKILLMIFGNELAVSFIIYLLTILITIGTIYIITIFMKKYMTKIYNLLIGQRLYR